MKRIAIPALSVLLVLVAVGGAAAQVAPDAAPSRITLAAQPAWTALGGDLPLDLRLDGAADALEIRITAHQAVTSRSTYDRQILGDAYGSRLGSVTFPVPLLGEVTPGVRRFILNLPGPNGSRGPAGVPIRRQGIYPLEVELRDPEAGTTLDSFVTHLVAVDAADPAPVATPLSVAWLWHVVTQPSSQPDGALDPTVLADMAAVGRLGRLAMALGAAADAVPLTVAPEPETLETWSAAAASDAGLASTYQALRHALTRSQVVTGPYVPLDIPSLISGGFAAEVTAQLGRGADVLTATLMARLDPRTALTGPVDAASLSRLRDGGVDLVVVPGDALVPVESKLTPARPFALDAGGRTITAAAPEPVLSTLLRIDLAPALAAQHVLAGLALVALEAPNDAPRGIVLDTPAEWDPPRELTDALASGLQGNPLLAPGTLDDYFATVHADADDPADQVVRTLLPLDPARPPMGRSTYDAAAARQRTLESLLPANDPGVLAGQKALLTSLSSGWGDSAAGRRAARAQLDVIDRTLATFLAQIETPAESTVTLTARTGEIPITLRNTSDREVAVRIRLDSPKLEFPDGPDQVVTLPAEKDTTVRVRVSARSSGTFPVSVTVLSADGLVEIGQTRMTIRSTVFSGVGIFLAVGAGLFLAIWWVLHFRRSRRQRRGTRRLPRPVPAAT